MKTTIENTVEDLVSDLLYYDRKEDEDLPIGAIETAIDNGEITQEDIVSKFRECLNRGIEGERREWLPRCS